MTSRLRGLRPLMLATPEHALIRAVCGQLIRSSDALAIERRIIRRLGRPYGRFMLAPAAETLSSAHPARPVPPEHELVRGGDHALFWTLSFAVTASTWRRVGGFCI
jgi:hypothetical protein